MSAEGRGPAAFARVLSGLLLLACLLPARADASATVDAIRLHEAPDSTRVVLDTSARVDFEVFSLENPSRVVIDVRRARGGRNFDADRARIAGTSVRAVRAAPRGQDLRIVLEVTAARTPKGFTLAPVAPYGNRLVVDLFGSAPPAPRPGSTDKPRASPQGRRDVIVAIDAGHGGEDPGAIGPGRIAEKRVVLAIAQELERLFDARAGFRGELIRRGDYYISLRERTRLARQKRADFFVSVHADAFRSAAARGASVYTLSERGATSEAARWLAEKENASDLIGGVGDVSLDDKDDLLAEVLLDLSMDGNRSASIEAGQSVLRALGSTTRLHRRTVEQAGFAVLKSPDIPSMLVETGYISNPDEARALAQSGHQRKLARAIFDGLVAYLERKPPPGTLVAARGATSSAGAATSGRRHVIQRGDTLSTIADRYRVSARRLKEANRLDGDVVRIGQVLVIPAS